MSDEGEDFELETPAFDRSARTSDTSAIFTQRSDTRGPQRFRSDDTGQTGAAVASNVLTPRRHSEAILEATTLRSAYSAPVRRDARSFGEERSVLDLPVIPGVKMPNIGSTARDHLANERTYLAWFRSAFAVVALGFAVVALGDVGTREANILVVGWYRFRKIQNLLLAGEFSVEDKSFRLITFVTFFVFLGFFVALLVTELNKK
ncbi:MAG: hypothetical protein MHM6MM_006748 [Cercozoa sp. M6MM]